MPILLSPEQVRERLNNIGVDLLSTYDSSDKPIQVRFRNCGHIKNVYLFNVLRGHGCLKCANEKARLDKETVSRRLFTLGLELVGDYTGAHNKILVRCIHCNHQWQTQAQSPLHGRKCPKCNNLARSLTQEEIIARYKKLRLTILDSYRNSRSRIKVCCDVCHYSWLVMAGNISKGLGCPKCRGSSAEALVREIIEKLTGWKFPSTRPSWLRGKGKRLPLELDGFNEEHRVAFEYQGWCHYHPIHGEQKLAVIKRRDECKRFLCRKHGVLLIRVPYWKKDVYKFLETKLRKAGLLP